MVDYGVIVPPYYHLYFVKDYYIHVGAAGVKRQEAFVIYMNRPSFQHNNQLWSPNIFLPILILGSQSEFKSKKVLQPFDLHKEIKHDFLEALYQLEPSLVGQPKKKIDNYLFERAQRLIKLQILR